MNEAQRKVRRDSQGLLTALGRMRAATTSKERDAAAMLANLIIQSPVSRALQNVSYDPSIADVAATLREERAEQSQRHIDLADTFETSLRKAAEKNGLTTSEIHPMVQERLRLLTRPS